MSTYGKNTILLDKLQRPIRDLRISVTDRCNFRCPYCMPADIFGERYQFLPKSELLTFDEIERITRIFVNLGVKKIRFTGGEPLLRNNIEELIAKLATIPKVEDLALTTNGYLLAAKAKALKIAGINRITVSLDSLDDKVFSIMNGRGYNTKRVLEGIKIAEKVGLNPIKINAVVQKGVNEHTIIDLARFCKDNGYIVRFIEFMDVGNLNGWNMAQVVPAKEIVKMIDEQMPLKKIDENYKGEVANRYSYKDGNGEIGVIASVTQPFCSNCNRARLTNEGKLMTCLFATGGTDLREPMRNGVNDEDLQEIIENVWKARTDRYSEIRADLTEDERVASRKIEMYQIGG